MSTELWFHFGYIESLDQAWEATTEQFSVPITAHSSSSDCHVTVILLVGGRRASAEGLHKNSLPVAPARRGDVFSAVFMNLRLCVPSRHICPAFMRLVSLHPWHGCHLYFSISQIALGVETATELIITLLQGHKPCVCEHWLSLWQALFRSLQKCPYQA